MFQFRWIYKPKGCFVAHRIISPISAIKEIITFQKTEFVLWTNFFDNSEIILGIVNLTAYCHKSCGQ